MAFYGLSPKKSIPDLTFSRTGTYDYRKEENLSHPLKR